MIGFTIPPSLVDPGKQGPADDGKRCSSAERLEAEKNIYLRVRGSGRGDTQICPDSGGVADFHVFSTS